MDALVAIGEAIEKLSLYYPLGPIVVLASLYFIYDGYKASSGAQICFATVALLWSLFTIFTFLVH